MKGDSFFDPSGGRSMSSFSHKTKIRLNSVSISCRSEEESVGACLCERRSVTFMQLFFFSLNFATYKTDNSNSFPPKEKQNKTKWKTKTKNIWSKYMIAFIMFRSCLFIPLHPFQYAFVFNFNTYHHLFLLRCPKGPCYSRFLTNWPSFFRWDIYRSSWGCKSAFFFCESF